MPNKTIKNYSQFGVGDLEKILQSLSELKKTSENQKSELEKTSENQKSASAKPILVVLNSPLADALKNIPNNLKKKYGDFTDALIPEKANPLKYLFEPTKIKRPEPLSATHSPVKSGRAIPNTRKPRNENLNRIHPASRTHRVDQNRFNQPSFLNRNRNNVATVARAQRVDLKKFSAPDIAKVLKELREGAGSKHFNIEDGQKIKFLLKKEVIQLVRDRIKKFPKAYPGFDLTNPANLKGLELTFVKGTQSAVPLPKNYKFPHSTVPKVDESSHVAATDYPDASFNIYSHESKKMKQEQSMADISEEHSEHDLSAEESLTARESLSALLTKITKMMPSIERIKNNDVKMAYKDAIVDVVASLETSLSNRSLESNTAKRSIIHNTHQIEELLQKSKAEGTDASAADLQKAEDHLMRKKNSLLKELKDTLSFFDEMRQSVFSLKEFEPNTIKNLITLKDLIKLKIPEIEGNLQDIERTLPKVTMQKVERKEKASAFESLPTRLKNLRHKMEQNATIKPRYFFSHSPASQASSTPRGKASASEDSIENQAESNHKKPKS